MVERKFLKSEKNVFWEALIITIFVFLAGLLIGMYLENLRAGNIENLYFESELRIFDLRIESELLNLENINCSYLIEKNKEFGDKIFEEAVLLKNLEESEDLTDALKIQHKKYDILRALFWINSIKIKEKCKADYHNIIYLYDYNDLRLDVKAKQNAYSKILRELKDEQGNSVLLIPMAGDNDVLSITSLMDLYNISEQELPVILIDEKIKVIDVKSAEQIEQYLIQGTKVP